MAGTFFGDVCAFIPGSPKNRYVRIGSAFRNENGEMSFKIDSIPLPNSGWTGWINVFDKKKHNDENQVSNNDVPF